MSEYTVDLQLEKYTLDSLLKNVPVEERAAAAIEILDRYRMIKQQVFDLEVKRDGLRDDYDKKYNAISAEIRELRKTCDHPEESYEPDPSGNNDSSHTCVVCRRIR